LGAWGGGGGDLEWHAKKRVREDAAGIPRWNSIWSKSRMRGS
jgi:hypothetical protein